MNSTEFRERSIARARMSVVPLNEWRSRLALYGLGLSGEAGEVVEEIKKVLFHDKQLDRQKLLSECGDVLWYLDRILIMIEATFEDAMQANDDKLSARHPNGWDASTNKIHHPDGL